MTWQMKPTLCPNCGHHVDAVSLIHTQEEPRAPRVGDLTVCIACAAPLKFGADLRLERLKASEVAMLDEDEVLALAQSQRAVMETLRRVGPPDEPGGRA